MTLKLTKQKCNKILENLDLTPKHANNITIREFFKILGMLEAAIHSVKYDRLTLFYSMKCLTQALTLSKGSYDCYFKLSSESIVEINWWKANIAKSYNTIYNELPKKIIHSDACPNIWGVAHENMSSVRHWSVEEIKLHINVLELLAAYYALQIYCKNMFDTSVHLKVDNTTAVAWINKQTAQTELEFSIVKQIWNFAAQRKLEIYASYIESKKNKIADFETRNDKDNLEWALKDHIFTKVKIKLAHPTIDLFASRGNNKVKTFYSFYPDPLASGVDGFSFDLSQDIIYAFPPFNLIPLVLQKIENEKTEGILVVPIFINQSWFTRLLTLLIKEPLWLPSPDVFLTFTYRRKSIPYLPKTRLMACYMSGDACKSSIFRAKLQTLLSNYGNQGRVANIISIYPNGGNFVVKGTLVSMKQL